MGLDDFTTDKDRIEELKKNTPPDGNSWRESEPQSVHPADEYKGFLCEDEVAGIVYDNVYTVGERYGESFVKSTVYVNLDDVI